MRFLPRWVPLACLAAWVVWAPEARAFEDHVGSETVSVAPTETVLTVPTSSVLSTLYALPTHVPPTVYSNSYVPTTSSLSPTVHVLPTYRTTSYPGQRRVVEGPFYTTAQYDYPSPTTYCTPMILECPVATIRELPCATTEFAPPATTAPTIPSRVQQAPEASTPSSSSAVPRQGPRAIISEPKEKPPLETEATPVPDTGDVTPLAKPETPPSVATQLRETAFQGLLPTSGIVDGKVVSGTTGQAVWGMRIIASHRLRPRVFTDREAKTDALGRFAIKLPAGDWAIKGVRPDGKTFSVKDITVSGDRITSDAIITLDPVPPGKPTLDLSPTSDTGPLGDHRTSAARVLLIGARTRTSR